MSCVATGTCGTLASGLTIAKIPSYYAEEQLQQYLNKIGYHASAHQVEESFDSSLHKLQLISRLHLVAFPFENTAMHYTSDHTVDVSPEGVFRRLVVEGQGGSYCFGQNTLLLGMLRRLGYRAYSGAGRVLIDCKEPNTPPPGLYHMIIFTQPFEESNTTYLVDVGFGGSGLCRPILLSDHPDNQVHGTTAQEKHRLIKKDLFSSALPAPAWELQVSRSEKPWQAVYAFTEQEFFLDDYKDASYSLCKVPDSRGTLRSNLVVCKHFFVNENDKLDGDLGKYVIFGSELRRSVGTQSELIQTFGKGQEQERIRAVKECFGIAVDEKGEQYIQTSLAVL